MGEFSARGRGNAASLTLKPRQRTDFLKQKPLILLRQSDIRWQQNLNIPSLGLPTGLGFVTLRGAFHCA